MFDISIEIMMIAFAIFCLIAPFFVLIFKKKKKYPFYPREKLLTEAELKFYKVLKSVASPQYDISCKVRLGDIINCTDYYWKKGYGPQISARHIDFVLHEPNTSKIILCIELDDKSHNLPDRAKRDVFVNGALEAAQVPFLRVPVTRGYDMAKLQKDIVIALQ